MGKVTSNGVIDDFSVDHSANENDDILNTDDYLIKKKIKIKFKQVFLTMLGFSVSLVCVATVSNPAKLISLNNEGVSLDHAQLDLLSII